MKIEDPRIRWWRAAPGVVAALMLAGACGQGGSGPESAEVAAGHLEQEATVVGESTAAQNRVAELRQLFRVKPVETDRRAEWDPARALPREPSPVIERGVA